MLFYSTDLFLMTTVSGLQSRTYLSVMVDTNLKPIREVLSAKTQTMQFIFYWYLNLNLVILRSFRKNTISN